MFVFGIFYTEKPELHAQLMKFVMDNPEIHTKILTYEVYTNTIVA